MGWHWWSPAASSALIPFQSLLHVGSRSCPTLLGPHRHRIGLCCDKKPLLPPPHSRPAHSINVTNALWAEPLRLSSLPPTPPSFPMSPGRSEQRGDGWPCLIVPDSESTRAWESCINQSLGRALTSAMTQQEEWKARDCKTVSGLSRFISSQGQGEKMFGSWETASFEEDG